MNGIDADPSETTDDYTYTLTLEPTCATAQIEIELTPPPLGAFGLCDGEVALLSHPSIITHYRVVPPSGHARLLVKIDPTPQIGATPIGLLYLIAIAQFEAGDFSEWSFVSP